jgi:hypothetical protein
MDIRFGSAIFLSLSLSLTHNFDLLIHIVSSFINCYMIKLKRAPWPEYESELYRRSDRHLSAKLVPTFLDRGYHVVSVTDPYDRILGFLDRSRYFLFQVAPQLYSRGRIDPVPDPLLLRKSGNAGNRTRTSGSVARNSDHRGGRSIFSYGKALLLLLLLLLYIYIGRIS